MEVSSCVLTPSGTNEEETKCRPTEEVKQSLVPVETERGNRRERIPAQLDAHARRDTDAATRTTTAITSTSVALANAGFHVSDNDDDDDSDSSTLSSLSDEENSGWRRERRTTTSTATTTTAVIRGNTGTTESVGHPRVLFYQPQAPPEQYQLQHRNKKRSLGYSRQQQQQQQQSQGLEEGGQQAVLSFPGAYAVPVTGIAMVRESTLGWEDHTLQPTSLSPPYQNDRTNIHLTEPHTTSEPNNPLEQRRRTRLFTVMMLLAVVVVSTIVVIAVVLTRNKNNEHSSNLILEDNSTTAMDETTDEDAGHVRFTKLRPFLEKINSNTSVAWEDPQSPQSQALHWLIYEDLFTEAAVNVNGIPDLDRIQTRYLLAVFYFATGGRTEGGGSWRNTFNFTSPVLHECDWNSVVSTTNGGPSNMEQQGVICDDWFEVTAIILGKINHDRIAIRPAVCISCTYSSHFIPRMFSTNSYTHTHTQKQRTIGSVVVFP
jgi:hypothetical protein